MINILLLLCIFILLICLIIHKYYNIKKKINKYKFTCDNSVYYVEPIYKNNNPIAYSHEIIQKNAENIEHFSLDILSKNNYGYMSMYYSPPNHVAKNIINIDLYAGDILYIPKGWWHFICSDKNTLSFTMWNSKTNYKNYSIKRNIFKFPNTNIDINNLISWENSGNMINHNMYLSLNKYRKNIKNNKKNETIELIKKLFKENNIYIKNSTINLWLAFNKHCTPLHYDDDDNILYVASGHKHVQLLRPEISEQLLPTVITNTISKYVSWKETSFLFDSNKRAYGDAFWECDNISKNAIPSCVILFCFMKHYNFPKEAYQHILILQYTFGVQNIVYSCKLTTDKKPYLEIYFFSDSSNRKEPYKLNKNTIDLTKTISILENILVDHFKFNIIDKNKLDLKDAVFLSFEIHPEMYNTKNFELYDLYFSNLNKPNNCFVAIDYFQLKNNTLTKKGTFTSMSTKKYKFYWYIEKLNNTTGHYYVGMKYDEFITKLKEYEYLPKFITDIQNLKNIEISPLEFCETINNDNKLIKRSGIYGIV